MRGGASPPGRAGHTVKRVSDWHAGRTMLATPQNFPECRLQVRIPPVRPAETGKKSLCLFKENAAFFFKLHKRSDCLPLRLLAFKGSVCFHCREVTGIERGCCQRAAQNPAPAQPAERQPATRAVIPARCPHHSVCLFF